MMLIFVGLFVHHERQTGDQAPLLSAIASWKASDATSLHSSSSQQLNDLLDKRDDVGRNFKVHWIVDQLRSESEVEEMTGS